MVLVVTLLRLIIVCIIMDKSCRLAKEEGSSSFPSGAAGSCATQLVRAAMFCPSVHRQDRRCAELNDIQFQNMKNLLINLMQLHRYSRWQGPLPEPSGRAPRIPRDHLGGHLDVPLHLAHRKKRTYWNTKQAQLYGVHQQDQQNTSRAGSDTEPAHQHQQQRGRPWKY